MGSDQPGKSTGGQAKPSGFDAWVSARRTQGTSTPEPATRPEPAKRPGMEHPAQPEAEHPVQPEAEHPAETPAPLAAAAVAAGVSDDASVVPGIPAPQDVVETRGSTTVVMGSEPLQRDVEPTFESTTTAPQRPPKTKRSAMAVINRFVDATSDTRAISPLEKLREGLPADRLMGWVVTIVITAIAFFIRWWKIGEPSQIMFDETYYAKDAWSLLQQGYEGTWPGDGDAINVAFAGGDPSALSTNGSFIVHPEVGKWLIAAGEHLFGVNAFGWRFGSLIFGTLLVFMVIRLGRRLSRSTLIGGLAGILLTVDGLSFVMSRIALLDIFESFFILAGVACVVADRDYFRHKLAKALAKTPNESFDGRPGPLVFRPWLLLAGLMFGLGCASKWNAMYPLAIFGIMAVVWSITARRLAGARGSAWWALLKDGVPAFISMVVVAVGTYIATWIPWIMTSGGYDRDWGARHQDDWVVRHLGDALGSLWHYHVDMYGWHTGDQMAQATHSYASNPWGWPIVARTIGIYAENKIQPGEQGCTAPVGQTCIRVITGLGTPLLWWAAALALLAGLVWWLVGMDWRFSVTVLATCSTWIPWMFVGTRPLFSFYAITMIPFMVIGLAMAFGVILGPAKAGERRRSGAVFVGSIVALIILDFAFLYPALTGQLMIRSHWSMRMWFPGWI